jgi:hypothetical protein
VEGVIIIRIFSVEPSLNCHCEEPLVFGGGRRSNPVGFSTDIFLKSIVVYGRSFRCSDPQDSTAREFTF